MNDHSEDARESDLDDEDEEGISENDIDDLCESVYEEVLEERRALAEDAARKAVPNQRYGHTVVVYNNRAYLWGGHKDGLTFSTLHEYDPGTSTPMCCSNLMHPAGL